MDRQVSKRESWPGWLGWLGEGTGRRDSRPGFVQGRGVAAAGDWPV